jgi:hypothetical protein
MATAPGERDWRTHQLDKLSWQRRTVARGKVTKIILVNAEMISRTPNARRMALSLRGIGTSVTPRGIVRAFWVNVVPAEFCITAFDGENAPGHDTIPRVTTPDRRSIFGLVVPQKGRAWALLD